MRNIYYLKKYNTFKIVNKTNYLFIEGKIFKTNLIFNNSIIIMPNNKFFFKDKSKLFLFKSLVLNAIEKTLLVYFKKLTLNGIGFKCYKLNTGLLLLKIGYTHKIYYLVPYKDVNFLSKKGRLIIYGNNVNNINNVTYEIKNLRQPDSYKGKGIIFTDEKLKLKSSKKRI